MNVNDPAGLFPNTRWTLVKRAAGVSAEEAVEACGELLELYRTALITHLMYAWHLHREQAEDLLHDFITDKILIGDLLSCADQERGKFRTFILTSLNRYAISKLRKSQTARRSPGAEALIPLDTVSEWVEETVAVPAASMVYDLAWIREIIQQTLHKVEQECQTSGRAHYWELFKDRVVNPILHGETPTPYAKLVVRLGFSSPLKAASALFAVKKLFVRDFRAVIQKYVVDEGAVDDEIGELRAILSQVIA